MAANPQLVSGDNALNGINAALSELSSEIANFDGSQIDEGSVANDALALGKSFYTVALCTDRAIGVAAIASALWAFTLPNVDGASSSNWKYLGYSVSFQTFTTVMGAGAKFVVKKNGATMQDVDLTLVAAAGTPVQTTLGTAAACASGDVITVTYSNPASGSLQYCTLVLHFSQKHVGT